MGKKEGGGVLALVEKKGGKGKGPKPSLDSLSSCGHTFAVMFALTEVDPHSFSSAAAFFDTDRYSFLGLPLARFPRPFLGESPIINASTPSASSSSSDSSSSSSKSRSSSPSKSERRPSSSAARAERERLRGTTAEREERGSWCSIRLGSGSGGRGGKGLFQVLGSLGLKEAGTGPKEAREVPGRGIARAMKGLVGEEGVGVSHGR